jgi:hypothetical protein
MEKPEEKGIRVMATPATSIDHKAITERLESRLKDIDGVVSLHCSLRDGLFSTWVGTNRFDDETVLHAIFDVEDQIESAFPGVRFDFHIFAIPPGRVVEDFISNDGLVFKRPT